MASENDEKATIEMLNADLQLHLDVEEMLNNMSKKIMEIYDDSYRELITKHKRGANVYNY